MLLLLPLVVPYALSLPADKQPPPIRAITFDANALAPPALAALTKQIGDAGGFLGFLCLGFAGGSYPGNATR